MKKLLLILIIFILSINLVQAYAPETQINKSIYDQSKSFTKIKQCYGTINIKVIPDINAPDYYLEGCEQTSDNKWICSCSNPSPQFMYANITKNTYKIKYSYQITPDEYDWAIITNEVKFSIADDGTIKKYQEEDFFPIIIFGSIIAIITFIFGIVFLIKKLIDKNGGFEEI